MAGHGAAAESGCGWVEVELVVSESACLGLRQLPGGLTLDLY